MKKSIVLFFLILISKSPCPGQFTDRVWCFGDSAKMEFTIGGVSNNNPSGLFSYKPASTICDSVGNLLFYVGNYSNQPTLLSSYVGAVFDSNDQIILNGDSLDIETIDNDGTIILPIENGDSGYLLIHHRNFQNLNDYYYLWSFLNNALT